MTKTETFIPVPLIGSASGGNKGAFKWSYDKLACLGNGTEVFIVDTKSLEVVQVLSGHTSTVTHCLWLNAARQFVSAESKLSNRDICSADCDGQIIIWDALKSQQIGTFFHPEGSKILDIMIPHGSDLWVRTKLYILYSGNVLTIFDYVHGSSQFVPITSPVMDNLGISENFVRFSSDPYHASQYSSALAFLSLDGTSNTPTVCLSKFWDCVKDSKIVIHKRLPLTSKNNNNPGGAPNSGNSPLQQQHNQQMARSTSLSSISSNLDNSKRQIPSSSSIRKLVSDIIIGPDYTTSSAASAAHSQFSGSIFFHPGIKDTVIVSTEQSIYFLNIHFMTILNKFSMVIDKQPSIVQVIPTKSGPCLFTLHENGTLFLRKFVITGDHTQTVQLDTICYNDKFSGKKTEVVGFVVHPIDENCVIVYLSDGRLLKYELVDMKSTPVLVDLKPHVTTPSTPYVHEQEHQQDHAPDSFKKLQFPSSPKKSPILTNAVKTILDVEIDTTLSLQLKRVTHAFGQFTCIKSHSDLLVAGTTSGFVIVLKIVDHRLKALKKFTTHSCSPVSGIEFVSGTEILTWSNLTFSVTQKCELVLTEIWTGASKSLKLDEKHHISTISVSPLGQYFVLVYKNGAGPCELWSMDRRQLIKSLPNKLPVITCIHWRQTTNDKSKEETFYMTDLGTFLFTFRVEGNRFLNATCVKLENTAHVAGIPTSLFSREDMVYRVDSNGVLVVYNTTKKTASPSTSVGVGRNSCVLGIAKLPDQDTYVLQLSDNLVLWDFSGLNPKKIKVLHSGNLKTLSIDVLSSWVAYVPKGSNGVRLLPLDLNSSSNSSVSNCYSPTISQFHFPYFMNATEKAGKILNLCQQPNSTVSDLLALSKDFGSKDDFNFWSVVNAKWNNQPLPDVDIFCDRSQYKDVLVKTAQCVWASDFHKREEVAKILLWTGESERAAEILLDTEPSDASSYVLNGLKASIAVGSNNLPESSKAVLKIIATNLVACGDMDGGLELLCLLQKYHEACKYVESSNEWTKAMLLCKTSLNKENSEESLCKYAQFINNKKCSYRAATVYCGICGNFNKAIEVLFGARLRHLSYLLLFFCIKQGVPISISDHIQTAIQLDFARFIFECGLQKESIQFCESLGDKGKDLKQELEILCS